MVGFTSPEQDLQKLQNLDRLTKFIESTQTLNRIGNPIKLGTGSGRNTYFCGVHVGRENLAHSDGYCGPNNGPQCEDCQHSQLKPKDKIEDQAIKLLTVLMEAHYQETCQDQQNQSQTLYFDEDQENSNFCGQITADLALLSASSNIKVKQLEIYLQENLCCKNLYQNNKRLTQAHYKLDAVCQEIVSQVQSAKIFAYFAALTGNVTYLIRLINILQSDKSQTLRGDELFCPSLMSQIITESPSIVTNGKLPQDSDHIFHITLDGIALGIDPETKSVHTYKLDQVTNTWTNSEKIKIQYFLSQKPKFATIFENVFYLFIDHITYTYNYNDNAGIKIVDLNKQKFLTNETTAIVLFNHLEILYTTFVHKTDENKSKIITCNYQQFSPENKQNQYVFEILFDYEIIRLSVNNNGIAFIQYKNGDFNDLTFINLFEGKLSVQSQFYKFDGVVRDTYQEEIKQIYENNKLPIMPQAKKLDMNVFGYIWKMDNKQEFFVLREEGKCFWNMSETGSWEIQQEKIIVKRGLITYELKYDDDSYLRLKYQDKIIEQIMPISKNTQCISLKIIENKEQTIETESSIFSNSKVMLNNDTSQWSCENQQSWIKIEFGELCTFSAIAIFTGSVIKQFPTSFSFFIATPNKGWKHIRSTERKKPIHSYQSYITQLGYQRTNAVLICVRNEQDKILISQIAFMQEHFVDLQFLNHIDQKQLSKPSFKKIEGDSLFKIENIQLIDKKKVAKIQLNEVEQHFYKKESKQEQSSCSVGIYIATLINNITKIERDSMTQKGPLKYLHLYPTQEYLDEIILIEDDSIFKLLVQNICDNLNVAAQRNIIFKQDQVELIVQKMCLLKPDSLYSFIRLSNQLSTLVQKIGREKLADQDWQFEIQVRHICWEIINNNFDMFIKIYQSMIDQQQFKSLEQLILAFIFNPKLSGQVIHVLIDLIKNDKLPSSLKQVIEHIFYKNVIKMFLKNEDVKKKENYDEKGFLITQSELLSGGIESNQIHFFSEASLNLINECTLLCNDQTIKPVEISIDESLFKAIIEQGKNQIVDDILVVLQQQLQLSRRTSANQGQDIGLRLTRAAFAVMLKLNQNFQGFFEEVYEAIDLRIGEEIPEEAGEERNIVLKESCLEQVQFKTLQNVWKQASKMRTWLMIKKQSVSNKFKQIEDETERESKENIHIAQILQNVINKAHFLVKLNASKQFNNQTQQIQLLLRKPSYVKNIDQSIVQTDFKVLEQRIEAEDAGIESVLSCLQSPVLANEIQNQVENNYCAAVKRYTGLCLLNLLKDSCCDVAKCLQVLQQKDKLNHYFDGVHGGCNQQLEQKIRSVFFQILQHLGIQLSKTNDESEALILIGALQWQYQARDFDMLHKLNIFQLLSGKGSDNLIQKAWAGHFNTLFSKQCVITFVEIFFTVLTRINDQITYSQMKLKVHGDQNLINQVPDLRRVHSYVNEDTSSLLIDSALRAIFRNFDSFASSMEYISEQDHFLNITNGNEVIKMIFDKKEVQNNLEHYYVDGKSQVIDKWQKYFGKQATELQQFPVENYNDIVLENVEIVPYHQHPLSRREQMQNSSSWRCDNRGKRSYCMTNDPKVERWYCSQCDFDMCKQCLKMEKCLDQHIEKNFSWAKFLKLESKIQIKMLPEKFLQNIQLTDSVVASIHPHPFQFHDSNCGRSYNSYVCNGFKNDRYCRYDKGSGNPKNCNVWRCYDCQFDLCVGCLKVDQCIKNFKDQIEQNLDLERFLQFVKNRTDQVTFLPIAIFETIELQNCEKVASHKHILEKQSRAAKCWIVAGGIECRSVENKEAWVCSECNFELCRTCMQIDKTLKPEIITERDQVKGMLIETQEETTNKLMQCVKLLSSVSLIVPKTGQILKLIASPYYIKTLLQLLSFVSENNKYLILQTIQNLVQMKLPLDFEESSNFLGNQLADALFVIAKQFFNQNKFDLVKIVIKAIQKLDINLQKQLDDLDYADQILVLWLSGAQLKKACIGDNMMYIKQELPVDENLTFMSYKNSSCVLFDQNQNSKIKYKLSELILIDKPVAKIILDCKQVTNLFKISDVKVQVILLNMFLHHKQYAQSIQDLQPILIEIIKNQPSQVTRWNKERSNTKYGSMITDEIEQSLAKKIFEETQKIQLPKRNLVKILFKQKRQKRNLIKSLYRTKTPNQEPKQNKSLYEIQPEQLIENQIIKSYIISNKIKQVKHQNLNEYQTFRNDWNNLIEPLEYTLPSINRFPLFAFQEIQQEFVNEKEEFRCNFVVLRDQRIQELLFWNYNQNDSQLMWHFKEFYLNKKIYNLQKSIKKQGLTKRFLAIINSSESFKKQFIERTTYRICKNLKKTNLKDLLTLRILAKITSSSKIIELIICSLSIELQDNVYLIQQQCSALLNSVSSIIDHIVKTDLNQFKQIAESKVLQQFFKASHQHKPQRNYQTRNIKVIYQFIYLANKIELQIDQAVQANRNLQIIWETKESIAQFSNFTTILNPANTLQSLIGMSSASVFEDYIEVQEFGVWVEVNVPSIQIRITQTEKQYFLIIYEAKSKTLKKAKKHIIESKLFDLKLEGRSYIMFSKVPIIEEKNLDKEKRQIYSLVNQLPETGNYKYWPTKFGGILLSDNQIYSIAFGQIKKEAVVCKLNGFEGTLKDVIFRKDSQKHFSFINHKNIPFELRNKTKHSCYQNNFAEKISFIITELDDSEKDIFKMKGLTYNKDQLNIVAILVEQCWSIIISQTGQEDIEYEGTHDSKKKCFKNAALDLKLKYNHLLVTSRFQKKYPEQSFDAITMLDQDFCAIFERNLFIIDQEDLNMEIQENVLDENLQATDIYLIEEQLIIDTIDKQGKKALYLSYEKDENKSNVAVNFLIDNIYQRIFVSDECGKTYCFGLLPNGSLDFIRIEQKDKVSVDLNGQICKDIIFCEGLAVIILSDEMLALKNKDGVLKPKPDVLKDLQKVIKMRGIISLNKERLTNFIDFNSQGITKIEYSVPSNNQIQWKPEENELKECIQFLNSKLKKLSFHKLYQNLLHRQKRLKNLLDLNDLENHNSILVDMIISANQLLIDNKGLLLAMAQDQKYTQMQNYAEFADLYCLPHLIFVIQRYAQKFQSQAAISDADEPRFRFNRLTGSESVFEQLFRQAFKRSTELFSVQNYDAQKPFRAHLVGENSYDAGGPFRDLIENISSEITTRFLKQTGNMEVLDDLNQYQPRVLNDVNNLKRFLLIGKMIGWALQSDTFNLSIDFNVLLWKRLLKIPITINDLKHVDQFRYDFLQMVLQGETEATFEADLGDGISEELCEGGSQILVNLQNRDKFVTLYLEKYLAKDEIIYESIIRGIKTIARPELIRLLTPLTGGQIGFSSPKTSAEAFCNQIRGDNQTQLYDFKQMVKAFTNNERQALLKFITGSSRLAPGRIIRIETQEADDSRFPIGHTCHEYVDCPVYSSLEIMKNRFRRAIECGEIDDDHDYYGNESQQSNYENDYDSESRGGSSGSSGMLDESRLTSHISGAQSSLLNDSNQRQSNRRSSYNSQSNYSLEGFYTDYRSERNDDSGRSRESESERQNSNSGQSSESNQQQRFPRSSSSEYSQQDSQSEKSVLKGSDDESSSQRAQNFKCGKCLKKMPFKTLHSKTWYCDLCNRWPEVGEQVYHCNTCNWGRCQPQCPQPDSKLTLEEMKTVDTIVEMGFSQKSVIKAYLNCGKDQEKTIEFLIAKADSDSNESDSEPKESSNDELENAYSLF